VARILVVDDDRGIRETVAMALAARGHEVVRAESVAAARAALARPGVDLIVCDIYMPGETGLDLLAGLRRLASPPRLILMTARGSVETAALASRIGAFDYLAKPFDVAVLLERVVAALAPPAPPAAAMEPGPESMIVGSHPAIVEVYKAVARVAPLRVPVLIVGETGTGKELVARALHRFGASPTGPFVAVNCGAIPDTLLESELFGHRKGAFTDARHDRRGALAQGAGGTVFLDEVGDVSAAFQVKLLRFLQDGVVTPLGAETGERVDLRVVAATHQDLPALVAAGRFRQDFYFRLAGYEIRLPPLRERLTDLPLLVDHFRRRAEHELGAGVVPGASQAVLDALAAHSWPGNVRELEQVVRRLAIDARSLADDGAARRVLRSLAPPEPAAAGPAAAAPPPTPPPAALGSLEEAEREHLLRVLAATGGNRSAAARILAIERKTLTRKLRRLGIDLDTASGGGE
jgi:DNA-binding NtrC family response regulator